MRAISQARECGDPEAWQFPVILQPPTPAAPVPEAQDQPQPADPAQRVAQPAPPQAPQAPQPDSQAPQANQQAPQLPAAQPVPGIPAVQAVVQPDPLPPGQVQLRPASWESFSSKFLKDFKESVKQYRHQLPFCPVHMKSPSRR